MESKICCWCGVDYISVRGNTLYCSVRCKNRFIAMVNDSNAKQRKKIQKENARLLKKLKPLNCIYCNRLFKKKTLNLKQSCCSIKCRVAIEHDKVKLNRKRIVYVKKCIYCGVKFNTQHPDKKACTEKHRIMQMIKVRTIARDNRRKETEIVCGECNKKFTAKITAKQKYCSKKCVLIASKKYYSQINFKEFSEVYRLSLELKKEIRKCRNLTQKA